MAKKASSSKVLSEIMQSSLAKSAELQAKQARLIEKLKSDPKVATAPCVV